MEEGRNAEGERGCGEEWEEMKETRDEDVVKREMRDTEEGKEQGGKRERK